MRHRYIFIVVALLLYPGSCSLWAQDPDKSAGYTDEQLSGLLEKVRQFQLNLLETPKVIVAAGESGKAEFIPVLEEITQLYATPRYRTLAELALNALWQLGKPVEWFLEKAMLYETNPCLAESAIMIAARSPYDEKVRDFVLKTYSLPAIRDSVRSALAEARRALSYADTFATLKSPEEQIAKLISIIIHEAHFSIAMGWKPGDGYAALYWSQTELRKLSQKYPYLVAKAIAERAPAERKYLYWIVSPKTQSLLEGVERGEPIGPEDENGRLFLTLGVLGLLLLVFAGVLLVHRRKRIG